MKNCLSECFLCSWCHPAGGEQPREFRDFRCGRLQRAGGGHGGAVQTDRGGPYRGTPTSPRRDLNRQGKDDDSGIVCSFTLEYFVVGDIFSVLLFCNDMA